MSKSIPRAELVEARVMREEDFALEMWRARVPFPEMRRRAIEALGYSLNESALRGLVKSARARMGDISMTREERAERMQEEIDDRARRARYDLAVAHELANRPAPRRDDYADPDEYEGDLKRWDSTVTAATKMLESADRRLAAAQKDERDLHGLNAPTKIEADITTKDAASVELEAMLARLDAATEDADA